MAVTALFCEPSIAIKRSVTRTQRLGCHKCSRTRAYHRGGEGSSTSGVVKMEGGGGHPGCDSPWEVNRVVSTWTPEGFRGSWGEAVQS